MLCPLAWIFLSTPHFSVSQTDSVLLSEGGSQDAIEASRGTHSLTRCQLSLTSSPVDFSSHTLLSASCSDHWLQCDKQHRHFHAVEFSPIVPRNTLLHHMFLVTRREKPFETVSQPCSSLPPDGNFLFGFFETTAAASVRLPPHVGLLIGPGSRFVSTGLHLHYMDRDTGGIRTHTVISLKTRAVALPTASATLSLSCLRLKFVWFWLTGFESHL